MAKIKHPYVFTPARARALARAREKARLANIARGKATRSRMRRHYSGNPQSRGQGISGLKKNFVPYARVNKSSGTGGFNAGTIIPGTGKRIVFGGYSRVETTNKVTAIDRMVSKKARKLMPNGTARGDARNFWNKNIFFDNPTVRANVGKAQVRLGTSRRGGPTVIIRKGRHKVVQMKTYGGTKRYNRRMRTIQRAKDRAKKKPRPQRRGKR